MISQPSKMVSLTMQQLRIALSISALYLTQINIWRTTMVIKAPSIELDVTPSGRIRNAQSLFLALTIGLLEFGTQERVKRSLVVTRSLENNLYKVRSMMLFGLQSHLPLSPPSLMMEELKFGIYLLIHLAQW